jgi:hypothetical protein
MIRYLEPAMGSHMPPSPPFPHARTKKKNKEEERKKKKRKSSENSSVPPVIHT